MQRRLILVVAALALALGTASAPRAALAASMPFEGSLAIAIGLLDPIFVVGSGSAEVSVNGGGQIEGVALPAGAFAVEDLEVDLTGLGVPPFGGVLASVSNQAGSFALGGDGELSGAMPLAGSVQICFFDACSGAPLSSLTMPVDVVGAGGTAMAMSDVFDASITGAPWTTGEVEVAGLLAAGFFFSPDPDSLVGTTLQFVTPILISTDLEGFETVPAFGFLTLQFVPEPGTGALLGAGAVGLLAFGRRVRS